MIKSIVRPMDRRCFIAVSDYELGSDTVFVLLDDGSARLLDLGGSFYALSPIAAVMVLDLLQSDTRSTVDRLCSRFDVGRLQVESDLSALIKPFIRSGALRPRYVQAHARTVRVSLASQVLAWFL